MIESADLRYESRCVLFGRYVRAAGIQRNITMQGQVVGIIIRHDLQRAGQRRFLCGNLCRTRRGSREDGSVCQIGS